MPVLTDEEIDALSPAERRELISRLSRPAHHLISPRQARRMRRGRLALLAASSAALVPWAIYLGATLPDRYVVRNWSVTWAGFDLMMFAMFLATLVAAAGRRQLTTLASFGAGILLICDAWFDVSMAAPGDVPQSLATAVLIELPLAALLIRGALRLTALTAAQLWILRPGMKLRDVRIPFTDVYDVTT